MAVDVQILTCPLCQKEHSAANAKLVPGYRKYGSLETVVPERWMIECTGCRIPFYRPVENANGN